MRTLDDRLTTDALIEAVHPSPGPSSRPKQREIRRAMAKGRNAGARADLANPEAAEPKCQTKLLEDR